MVARGGAPATLIGTGKTDANEEVSSVGFIRPVTMPITSP